MKQPTIYAFIFARSGSKGLPGKNIRHLAGKPLIAYSIEIAKKIKNVTRIIVSTDDTEIACVAREWGAEVPFMRPQELATDDCPERLAWRHALQAVGNDIEGGPCEVFLSLPCTAPLRIVNDVEKCLDVYHANECDMVITSSVARCHPMFNMIHENTNGEVQLVIPPNKLTAVRQNVLPMFDITTVAYVACPKSIFLYDSMWQGRVRQVVLPRERAVDIDDAMDFAFAEFLVNRH